MQDIPDSSNDPPFTQREVRAAIFEMDTDKSPGEDLITAKMVQMAFTIFPAQFTRLYNSCLESGHFPRSWKIASVVVIPKPGDRDPSSAKSYRPICLISVLGKVLDKLMIRRITWHCKVSLGLSDKQYGFTPQTSTEDAVFDLLQNINTRRDTYRYTCMVSNDISGAFDHAWWPEIFHQLRRHNVPKNLFLLALSYFRDRVAKLTLNNVSSTRAVTMGCPQGSVSGPGFWNILINTLLEIPLESHSYQQAFADDTVALISSDSFQGLRPLVNEYLTRVTAWGDSVKLTFNPSKTSIMIFPELFWNGGRICNRSNPKCSHRFKMGRQFLEITDQIKYLGVIIDNKLSWIPHIKAFADRLKSFFFAMRGIARASWGLSTQAQKIIYRAIFEPIAAYCSSAYYLALNTPTKTRFLISAQRAALLQITGAFRDTSNDALPVLAGVLPIHLLIKERANLYLLKKGISGTEVSLPPLELKAKYFSGSHPAMRESFRLDSSSTLPATKYTIFTDGSKAINAVGSAFVVYKGNNLIISKQFALSPCCSAFQAELLSILRATELIRNNGYREVAIITDSQAAIQALTSYNPTHPLVRRIVDTLQHSNVILHWTPSHSGVPGNELADKLAKEAFESCTNTEYEAFPLTSAKRLLRYATIDKWNYLWSFSEKGRQLFAFFPDVNSRLQTQVFPDFYTSQLLTGHGLYYHHYKRMGRSSASTCRCGLAEDTVEHLVFECILLALHREQLAGTLPQWPCQLEDLVDPANFESFKTFARKTWETFIALGPMQNIIG